MVFDTTTLQVALNIDFNVPITIWLLGLLFIVARKAPSK